MPTESTGTAAGPLQSTAAKHWPPSCPPSAQQETSLLQSSKLAWSHGPSRFTLFLSQGQDKFAAGGFVKQPYVEQNTHTKLRVRIQSVYKFNFLKEGNTWNKLTLHKCISLLEIITITVEMEATTGEGHQKHARHVFNP